MQLDKGGHTKFELIPFRASHIFDIKSEVDDEMYRMAWRAQESGPAYTVCLYGHAIGAAGISVQKPGVGEAWTIFTPILKRMFPLTMHRLVKKLLAEHAAALNEVWAVCQDDGRWLKILGFFHVEKVEKPELYRKFGPGQALYVRRKWVG